MDTNAEDFEESRRWAMKQRRRELMEAARRMVQEPDGDFFPVAEHRGWTEFYSPHIAGGLSAVVVTRADGSVDTYTGDSARTFLLRSQGNTDEDIADIVASVANQSVEDISPDRAGDSLPDVLHLASNVIRQLVDDMDRQGAELAMAGARSLMRDPLTLRKVAENMANDAMEELTNRRNGEVQHHFVLVEWLAAFILRAVALHETLVVNMYGSLEERGHE